MSCDETVKANTKSHALNWIVWIEHQGDGKFCNDDGAFNNRCNPLKSNIFYETAKRVGAINSANENYDFVKSIKRSENWYTWRIEAMGTPVGYQTHLKTVETVLHYLLGKISDEDFRKMIKILYNNDKINPWHRFLCSGVTKSLVEKTLEVCPAQRLLQSAWTIHHHSNGN